jgi:3-oxoacyl-(acyl-carrier-protein) synthase
MLSLGHTNDAAQYLHRYFCESTKNIQKPIKKVLVNAVGFGGNAVSILL